MEDLNVCLVQMDLAWEDPEANRQHIQDILENEAGKHDLILLPEMFTTGFTMLPKGKGEALDGPTYAWMRALAQQLDTVLAGSLIVEEDGQYYNRLLAVGPEGLVTQYNKRHLFRMAGEHKEYFPGSEESIFTVKGWRIRPMVCYDLRFPVWSRNVPDTTGKLGYDVIFYVANWPAIRVSHWKLLLKARSVENQAFCLGVNRIGEDGNEIAYSGDSAIVDYLGKVLSTSSGESRLLTARLDRAGLERYREKFPAWQDADDFNLG